MRSDASARSFAAWSIVVAVSASCGPERQVTTETTGSAGSDSAGSTTLPGESGIGSSSGGEAGDLCANALFSDRDVVDIDIVGDLDGDGMVDLIVFGRDPLTDRYAASVITGGLQEEGSETFVESIVQTLVFEGDFPLPAESRVAGLGDVNGDGLPDIAVLTMAPDDGSGARARAYVVLGEARTRTTRTLTPTAVDGSGFVVEGPPATLLPGPPAGVAAEELVVNAAGDMNGDGLDDFAIVPATGATVYVVFGSADPQDLELGDLADVGVGFRILPEDPAVVPFPGVIVPWGDANGDGRGDLALTSPGTTIDGDEAAGWVSVVMGDNVSEDVVLPALGGGDLTIVGTGYASGFGASVAPAGDLDGDGNDEAWIGSANAYACPDFGCLASIYLVRGAPSGQLAAQDLANGIGGSAEVAGGNHQLGWALADQADWDGDGLDDLVTLGGAFAVVPVALMLQTALPVAYEDLPEPTRASACQTSTGEPRYPVIPAVRGAFLVDLTADGRADALVPTRSVLGDAPMKFMVLRRKSP